MSRTPPGYRLSAATGIHRGDRLYQQDQVQVFAHPRQSGWVLGIVADGMGGKSGGRKAADQVILTAQQLFERFVPDEEDESGGLLDSLPMAALVHRGETILAVNRPFLDMTRHADLESLRAAGIHAVFPGGPPNFRSGQSHETAIGMAEGGALPVEVTRGICAWAGGRRR